jgi:membrane protein
MTHETVRAANLIGHNFLSFCRESRLSWSKLVAIFSETIDEWSADNAPRLSASLAYYALLSMAPLLIVIIAVAALLFEREAAQGQLIWQIRGLLGPDSAATIQQVLHSAHKTGNGVLATIVSLLTMLFGGSAVVLELQGALNVIWHVAPKQEKSAVSWVLAIAKERFYAFELILGAGLLLLISLLLNVILSSVGHFVNSLLPAPEFVLQIEEFVLSLIVITILFAAIYKVLPSVRLTWCDVIVGAAFTALLFTIGKQLIGIYLGKVGVGSAYGAAGSLVVVLVWVYYSALLFFMGAEFTKVYARRHGSHQGLSAPPTIKRRSNA